MKWPTRIRITAKVAYDVLWVDGFESDTEDEMVRGVCDHETKQIVLRNGLRPMWILRTFIHEVFHAVEHEYDIAIPHKTIYKLERAFEKVLKLNRWI